MFARWGASLAIILGLWGLVGCGLTTPDIKEAWDSDFPGNPQTGLKPISGTTLIEFEIKKKIFCELKDAVAAANAIPTTQSDSPGGKKTLKYSGLFPPNWIAQVAISLQVDELVSLDPGLSFNQTMANAVTAFGVGNTVTTPQSFSLGFGATLSSTATRIDKFNPQYSIAFLSQYAATHSKYSVCNNGNDPFAGIAPSSSPFQIESSLGIKEWLVGALLVNSYLPSDVVQADVDTTGKKNSGPGTKTKADTISYEIKFVIISNGNVTPTWKLVKVSANSGSAPFFGVGRTRTHDLIITIGPNTIATDNASLASMVNRGRH